ncbi:hypothetical protein TraAM80_08176 [Trypanosoma rangeli]|uniref:Uncharacterized protein n=1 Tax=Trypanosoma rangeli TaxID=5698 RepID=A0A3R7KQM5_TRYRA|nr:uncharacterized protein TraAM80_08176 [Trypanosoma rangeli]RNE99456.1 hypothetical protein TraAM80_08176 [Trypanosoma rangeli]|eukprot:RNE99456.1 hypothetical protein TraAM80_08176 [Trypanosoma rangeli]
MTSGTGAHCIAEETQWMFTDDGSTIEVRRILGNTPQVHCSVSDPLDLVFGYLTMEDSSTEEVSAVISSNVRGFLTIDHVVQFFFEVVADNTGAVEQTTYTKALEAAKLEAKAQHDGLEQTKASKSSKEKVPLPTLAVLEEALISQISVPKEREQAKPMVIARALFRDGTAVTFSAAEKCLHFAAVRSLCHFLLADLVVDVCVGDCLRSIRVSHIDAITVYVDGCVVIHSQEVEGYRVSLDVLGNYITVNSEGSMLYVTASGKRSIVKVDGQTLDLEPLMVAAKVDTHTGAQVLLRQDGVQVVLGSGGGVEKITYCTGCSCVRSDGENAWHFKGFPEIRFNSEAGRLGFTVDRMEAIMDVGEQTLHMIHHRSGGEAILDWTKHWMHVRTMPNGNCFTIDCAFGGLVASSDVSHYYVSPFGRCGEVREDVFKEPEIVNQEFLQRYEGAGGNFGETALQSNCCMLNFPIKLMDSNCRPTMEPKPTTLSSYTRYAEGSLESLRVSGVRQSKDLLRGVVGTRGGNGDDGVLVFMMPWLSNVLLQRLKNDINPTYSRLFLGLSLLGGDVQEHIIFLESSHEGAREERGSTTPMASSVAQFLLTSQLPKATEAPCGDNVHAMRILLTREGAVLMTDDVATLLRHDRLSSSAAEKWSKAMQTLPLVETAEVTALNSSYETRRSEPLYAYTVSGRSCTRPVAPRKEARATRDAKYNFWRSTGILVAAEVKEATLNERNDNASTGILTSEGTHAPFALAASPAADISEPIKNKGCWVPFMHTMLKKEMPPQEYRSVPSLSVTPSVLSFGRLLSGNRYAIPLTLTNTSTVPCRYRVTLPTEYRSILRVHYPRHFLAPGLTVVAQVEVSGTQPPGTISVVLGVTHEGGSVTVAVHLETVEKSDELSSAIADDTTAVFLGPTLINLFVPGTTRRLPPLHILKGEEANKEAAADALESM